MNKSYMNRKHLLKSIPNTLRRGQWERIKMYFNNECPLTGRDDVVRDHFIPINWGPVVKKYGIGGTTYANVILLARSINSSKGAMNPFEWFERYGERHGVSRDKWMALLAYIAGKHKMTVNDYMERVNACYSEVLAKKWMERINSITTRGNYIHPVFLAQALKCNIVVSTALEAFGSDRTKRIFLRNRTLVALAKEKESLQARLNKT